MPRLHIRIVLDSDVSFSQSARSTGGHRSLRHVPGAALAGAFLGAHLRGVAGPERADRVFDIYFSGALRFGDGLPEGPDGARCLPVPMALHHPKAGRAAGPGEREDKRAWIDPSVVNLAAEEWKKRDQPKQIREGFLAPSLEVVRPAVRYSMRTAVDPDGRPEQGLLYGIEALSAGQSFRAWVDADDATLLEAVRDRLDGATIRLGRSRGAEFGWAHVEVVDEPGPTFQQTTAIDDFLSLWCLSDLCLRDPETGSPTLVPVAGHFGLPNDWQRDDAHSFLRTRRYSPFDRKRGRHDLERQVIEAGSVVVFRRGSESADLDDLRRRARRGFGEHTAQGLGEVLVAPTLLQAYQPPAAAVVDDHVVRREVAIPADDLGRWLSARIVARKVEDDAMAKARALAGTWRTKGWGMNLTNAQWGNVAQLAGVASDRAALVKGLRDYVGSGTRQLSRTWGASVKTEHGRISVGEALLRLVDAKEEHHPKDLLDARGVRLFARQMRRPRVDHDDEGDQP